MDLVLADACAPPFSPGYFDVVLCCNLIEHLECPAALLAGIRRVLRPGGALVLSTPSRYRFGSILRVLSGRSVNLMSSDHITEYSVGQIIEILQYCGFQTVSVMGHHRRPEHWTTKRLLVHGLILGFARGWRRLANSHSVLSSTMFVLARHTTAPQRDDQQFCA